MSIRENYAAVLAELKRRGGAGVQLLPVTKTVGADSVRELYDLGVRDFGENRVEVLAPKAAALPEDIRWHFIGHLQSNKVRKVLQLAAVIHSVDSLELAERIDRIAGEEGKHPRVLLEISVSGEECKGGFPLERARELVQTAVQCRNFETVGLMTMAPLNAAPELQHAVFAGLRDCRDRLAAEFGIALPELSMGMSGDWPEAVACGATMVRIGSAIFRT